MIERVSELPNATNWGEADDDFDQDWALSIGSPTVVSTLPAELARQLCRHELGEGAARDPDGSDPTRVFVRPTPPPNGALPSSVSVMVECVRPAPGSHRESANDVATPGWSPLGWAIRVALASAVLFSAALVLARLIHLW